MRPSASAYRTGARSFSRTNRSIFSSGKWQRPSPCATQMPMVLPCMPCSMTAGDGSTLTCAQRHSKRPASHQHVFISVLKTTNENTLARSASQETRNPKQSHQTRATWSNPQSQHPLISVLRLTSCTQLLGVRGGVYVRYQGTDTIRL